MPEPGDTKPTDPGALLERVERTGQDACPCRWRFRKDAHHCCAHGRHRDDPGCCACCPLCERGEYYDCVWPGHAAISRAVRIARLAGRVEQADKDIRLMTNQKPMLYPTPITDERDRLRAELAKEAGDGK